MELDEYQDRAQKTDQPPRDGRDPMLVPILGLAGEAGTLLDEYKKVLRDGSGHRRFKDHVHEELGDLLWYVAVLAAKAGISLEDVAQANLAKVADRWTESDDTIALFDEAFPETERLPRDFEVVFAYDNADEQGKVIVRSGGVQVGNLLTDNAYDRDGYRFHDVYHYTFAAILGWSPVTRRHLKRKRKSVPRVDEVEDGGRGWVIEEAIAALSFAYASEHGYFDETDRVDASLLKTIHALTATVEVSSRSARDWERAIVSASRVWKLVNEHDGGTIVGDLLARTISYTP